jgi:hypothetical protein
MDLIEAFFHLLERGVAFGLVVATAFGMANLIAGVIVTLLGREHAPPSQQD